MNKQKEIEALIIKVLALLRECPTCGDSRQVMVNSIEKGIINTDSCPDCQSQEPDDVGEFVKRMREWLKDWEERTYHDCVEKITEAYDHLEEVENSKERKDEYWIKRQNELEAQLQTQIKRADEAEEERDVMHLKLIDASLEFLERDEEIIQLKKQLEEK